MNWRRGLAALVFLASGCFAAPRPLEAPVIRLDRIAPSPPEPAEPGAPRFAVTITLQSRDDRAMTVEAIDWTLGLDDGPPRRGRIRLAGPLRPRQTRVLGLELRGRAVAGPRRYDLALTVHLRAGTRSVAAFLDESGALSARPGP